jgi:hypothetical protein
MRTFQLLLAAVLPLLVFADAATAQSLADVARAEQARRKGMKREGKVYTNDDLKGVAGNAAPEPPATSPATPASGETPASPGTAAKPEPEKPAPKTEEARKDEKYWKERMTALQNALSRNKILADALQSRVNALTADFASRDNPVQRAGIEKDRRSALAEMDRVKQDTEKTGKAITALEEEARKANVPPGWLR